MKKTIIFFVVISSLLACKKSTSNSSTNISSNVICTNNPNINFTSIGTPIGEFADCIKDIDGNVYKTVNIGNQTWMAENLKVSKYNDGTIVPNIKDSTQWTKLKTGSWVLYDNNNSYNNRHGKLYNWYAVSMIANGNKNICPAGWHVPIDEEWSVLVDYLGRDGIATQMKEVGTTSVNGVVSTNISLFTGLPSGVRTNLGNYYALGGQACWWSSTQKSTSTSWVRGCDFKGEEMERGYLDKVSGLSVRCLKD